MPLILFPQLQLHCRKTRAKLKVDTCIQISAIHNIDHVQHSTPSVDLLSSHEIWAARGDGLHLSCKVLVNGTPLCNDPQGATLLERLAGVVRSAELWKQLHLRPSLALPSLSDDADAAQADILLSIHHSDQSRKERFSSKRRVAQSYVPIADTKPPFGIPSVDLERIDITLDFCLVRPNHLEQRSKRAKTVAIEPSKDLIPDTEENEVEHVLLLNKEYHSQPIYRTAPSWAEDAVFGREWASQPANSSKSEALLDGGVDDFQFLLLGSSIEMPEGSADAATSRSNPIKRPAEETPLRDRLPTDELQLQDTIQLTDAALRNIICNKPLHTVAGIRIIEDNSPQHARLDNLAPSLWSPGYLPAIAQRAFLIPKIGQVLSSFLNRARSNTLRLKLATIGSISPSPFVGVQGASNTITLTSSIDPQTISKVVHARLWRMMQQRLYDPNAARRLSPVIPLPTAADQSGQSPRVMREILEDRLMESIEPDELLIEYDVPELSTSYEPSHERSDWMFDDAEMLLREDSEAEDELAGFDDQEVSWLDSLDNISPRNPEAIDYEVDELLTFSDAGDGELLLEQELSDITSTGHDEAMLVWN